MYVHQSSLAAGLERYICSNYTYSRIGLPTMRWALLGLAFGLALSGGFPYHSKNVKKPSKRNAFSGCSAQMGHYLREICGFQCIEPAFRNHGEAKKIRKLMFGFYEYDGGSNLFDWPICDKRGRGKAIMCQSGIAVSVHQGTVTGNCMPSTHYSRVYNAKKILA